MILHFLISYSNLFYTLRVSPPPSTRILRPRGCPGGARELQIWVPGGSRGNPGVPNWAPGGVPDEPGSPQKLKLERRGHQERKSQFPPTPLEAKTLKNHWFFNVFRGSGQGSKEALPALAPPHFRSRGGGRGRGKPLPEG